LSPAPRRVRPRRRFADLRPGPPLRVGLFGTGPWARLVHAPALAAHPGVDLVGVWGRRPERAAELAAGFGARGYADAGALIAAVDAVAVALPPDVQAPLAARAARAGRHLLLDKPLALDPRAAREVADAAERSRVRSAVFLTLRFDARSAEWIAEQAATGGWFTGRADWYGSVFGADAGDSPFAGSPWRRERGGLWDLGPHALSVLLPVLGDVTGVAAARGRDDTVHLTLRHEGGASSTSVLTLSAPEACAGSVVEFRGARGTAVLPEGCALDPAAAYGRMVDALLGPEPPECDARFALRVTEVLAAAQEMIAGD
jgi:predicted dehydrogenase